MPKKYIPYEPVPLRGQALLGNIPRPRRLLTYRGNDGVFAKLDRGMPYYESEILETVGAKSDNMLIQGECLTACAMLKTQGVKVDLVYIDPPFASGADYAKQILLRPNPELTKKARKAAQALDNEDLRAFEEKIYGDVWRKENYLNWMYENLCAIRSVMAKTASIYVHLDWHIGHYVKVLLDEVFGDANFRNEIVWKKLNSPKAQSDTFGNQKDSIFYYTMSEEGAVFNKIYRKAGATALNAYRYDDNDGRGKYRLIEIEAHGDQNYPGRKEVVFKGRKAAYLHSLETLKEFDKAGLIYTSSTGRLSKKKYLSEMKGVLVSDIWTDGDVSPIQGAEKIDYPTQKPEALLRRIIEASTHEGMLVADFFGGSGTAAIVANNTGRKFIHCDPGANSIQTARDRLKKSKAQFQIVQIKDGVNLFRNPKQTMEKLARFIPGLRRNANGNNGGNGFWFGSLQDSKLGTIPVYVPDLRDSSQKILDEVIVNKILNEELHKLSENDVKKVVVYYADIDDPKAVSKQIGENNTTTIKVELRDLKDILADTVVNDYAEFKCAPAPSGKGHRVTLNKFVSDRLVEKIAEFNAKNGLVNKTKPVIISDSGLELIEMVALDCGNKDGKWKSDAEIVIDELGFVADNGGKTGELWDGTITAPKRPLRLKIRNICGDEIVCAIEESPAKKKPQKRGK